MTVRSFDNRFDWCHELLEAPQNFTPEECCNTLKNALSKRKDADPDYVAAVTSRPNSAFPMRKLFYPVYEIHTTTAEGERKELDKAYHRGIYEELEPSRYVNRNDQRFYVLNHVKDLDGDLYDDHCVYSHSEIADAMQRDTEVAPSINRWTYTACMIPLIEITVEYDGGEYKWYFNAHNGAFFCEGYALASRIAEVAKRTARTLALLRILTYLAGISSIIVSLANITSEHWFASLFSLTLNLIGGSLVMANVKTQNESELLWEFREDGDRSAPKRKRGILLLVVACFLLACTVLCAIVW